MSIAESILTVSADSLAAVDVNDGAKLQELSEKMIDLTQQWNTQIAKKLAQLRKIMGPIDEEELLRRHFQLLSAQ